MSAWYPIDTGPKDGTRVLLFTPDKGVEIGEWHHSVRTVNGKVESDRAYWLVQSPRFSFDTTEPTHWMPLPDAPGATPAPKGWPEPLDQIARALTTYMRFQYGEDWETRRD